MNKRVLNGIDVSKHNQNIDWSKVDINIDFVIMRAGYGKEYHQKDQRFEEYFSEVKKINKPIGIYWYSYAESVEEAEIEAKVCLETIKNKKFEYPIYYDIEEKGTFEKGKEVVSQIAEKFCSILTENKYLCGIYCSAYFLKEYFNEEIKKKYPIWVAHWTNKDLPNYDGEFGIWQYSSKGKIDGIIGNVDLDYGFIDYKKIVIENHYNGY